MVTKKLLFLVAIGLSVHRVHGGEVAEKVKQSIEIFVEPGDPFSSEEDRTGHRITYSIGDKICTRTYWPIAPVPVAAARQPSTVCSHGLPHSTWDAMYKLWKRQEKS